MSGASGSDFNLWTHQTGDWEISGSRGLAGLAGLRINDQSDQGGLSFSIVLGSMKFQFESGLIELALREAELSFTSENFLLETRHVGDDFKMIGQGVHSGVWKIHPTSTQSQFEWATHHHGELPIKRKENAASSYDEIKIGLLTRPQAIMVRARNREMGELSHQKAAAARSILSQRMPVRANGLIDLCTLTLARRVSLEEGLPDLVLKGSIVNSIHGQEGRLVRAVTIPWFDLISKLISDPSMAISIPPEKWEEIVAGAYKKSGFDEVILTPRSGDRGRDVIATKFGLGSVRVIDQVKAYKPGHLVTAESVRAMMGLLHCDTASKGFITTTSKFAPGIIKDPLIAPLIPSRLELIDGDLLLKRLAEISSEVER